MSRSDFLTKEQEQRVVDAIAEAENVTSGEIRVHIENTCEGEPLERAKELFAELNMHKTELRNGVLLYIATDDHKVAVFGGKAIHDQVGQRFWDDTISEMTNYFRKGNFVDGMVFAVRSIGKQLTDFFPYQKDDVNELSDDISYNSNKDENA
jgi:uncharacterized membrane protein